MNNGVEYKVLLDMNTAVQKIVFAISLSRNGYTIEQIDNITRNYDFASDLLDLQVICIMLKELDKYNDTWATDEKAKIKEIGKKLEKEANNLMDKLEIMSIEKEMNEDIDYVLGNRSFPNVRNVKRLNALKMILNGKTYNEIINAFN